MDQKPMQQGEILLYNNDGEKEFVSVVFRDETFWLTQKAMAELFDVNVPAISKHLQNIYEEEELTRDATISKMETVQIEGSRTVRRMVDFYNLDAIIAVGYRVNSKKATRFRQWATKTLKEYITKGFVLNDDMLKNGKPFGRDYFDELLERIREIRASERRAYQKIADVFEQCSYDYDKNSETTKAFYAFVQNKLHFAVTGKTAAELISERATLDSPTMGLTTWKGGRKNSEKRYSGGKKLSQREGAVPAQPSGDHVHRLRRADGRGRAAYEHGGLAPRDRPLPHQQPAQGAGGQGAYLPGGGGEEGQRHLCPIPKETGCRLHLRV